MRYDKGGDEYYDIVSAFQKILRGSGSGCGNPLSRPSFGGGGPAVRLPRLMVSHAKDVGLAWPQIIPIVEAAVDAALQVGLPGAYSGSQTQSF